MVGKSLRNSLSYLNWEDEWRCMINWRNPGAIRRSPSVGRSVVEVAAAVQMRYCLRRLGACKLMGIMSPFIAARGWCGVGKIASDKQGRDWFRLIRVRYRLMKSSLIDEGCFIWVLRVWGGGLKRMLELYGNITEYVVFNAPNKQITFVIFFNVMQEYKVQFI